MVAPEDLLDVPDDLVDDPEDLLEDPEDLLVFERVEDLVPDDLLELPEDFLVVVPLEEDPRVLEDRTGVERLPLLEEVDRVLVPLEEVGLLVVPRVEEVGLLVVPRVEDVERVVPRVEDVERVVPVALEVVERVAPERVLVVLSEDRPVLIRVRLSLELTAERVDLPVFTVPLLAVLAVRPLLTTVRVSPLRLVTSGLEFNPLRPPVTPARPPRSTPPERLVRALLDNVDPRGP